MKNIIELLFKKPIWALVSLIVIVVFILIIETAVMKFLTHLDNKKTYNPERLKKKIQLREDKDRNYIYYGIDFWLWQKHKVETLKKMFPEGTKLQNGKTITDILPFNKVVPSSFNNGTRNTRYLRELRFLIANLHRSSTFYGDQVLGDKNSFINSGSGVQNISITKKNVMNTLENLLHEHELSVEDSQYLKEFVSKLARNQATENDKESLLERLSNYIGVVSGIASIIDVLHNFQIL